LASTGESVLLLVLVFFQLYGLLLSVLFDSHIVSILAFSRAVELNVEHGNRRGKRKREIQLSGVVDVVQPSGRDVSPKASTVRSTVLPVASRPANSVICSRPWSKEHHCPPRPTCGAPREKFAVFYIQFDLHRELAAMAVRTQEVGTRQRYGTDRSEDGLGM
jgi:hypothetical protein